MQMENATGIAKRVLVVDDEKPIRMLLREILEGAGYEVEVAAAGEEGYRIFSHAPCGIVITDLKMPGGSGEALFTQIKAEYPETLVIVLTGHASLRSAMEALHIGCDDYLLKPLPSVELILHSIDRCRMRRKSILQAAAFRRIAQANGEVLTIAQEELSLRLAELEECLDQVTAANEAGDPAAVGSFLNDMKASLSEARTVLLELGKLKRALSSDA